MQHFDKHDYISFIFLSLPLMCKDNIEINIRLQCLKLAYKNGCKDHTKTLAIARKNIDLVLKQKKSKKPGTKKYV
jgi:hypothetical protein